MTIRHSAHARYDLWYHLAWATKYRKKIFTNPETIRQVKETLRAIASHYEMMVGEVECLSDHIHMTLAAPPKVAPSRAAQILKSLSTKHLFATYPWLKQHYWGGEIWAAGYFVRSIGPGLTKEQIEKYIKEQSEEL